MNNSLSILISNQKELVLTPYNESIKSRWNLFGLPWFIMKSSSSTTLNPLLCSNNLNILWNTVGLKLIGWNPQITLYAGSKCVVHHNTNYGTRNTSGMQPTFTNPLDLTCFLSISFAGKSKHQSYSLDQLNVLLNFFRYFIVSPQNASFLFLVTIFWIKIAASYIGKVPCTCTKYFELRCWHDYI